jgi:hypothetical protein
MIDDNNLCSHWTDESEPTNETRAQAAWEAIVAHAKAKGEEPPAGYREFRKDAYLRDLLCDLMHLWGSGVQDFFLEDFEAEFRSAKRNYKSGD